MKKIFVTALAVVLMSVGIVGTASALSFGTTTENFNEWIWQGKEISWQMFTPAGFEIPFDEVETVKLTIYSLYVNTQNSLVASAEEIVGSLSQDGTGKSFDWNFSEKSIFDVATFITDPWTSATPLNLTLSLNNNDRATNVANYYKLDKAELYLAWNDKTDVTAAFADQGSVAPVPEPGTMALLGFGLLGLAIYGKRRMNRDA